MKVDYSKPFDWTGHWVPVAEARDIRGLKAQQIRMFGKEVAVWADKHGHIAALEDECPHRKARLSLGKVGDGGLQCGFHGWVFAGDGQLVHNPHARLQIRPPPERFCAKAIQVREHEGVVYLWPSELPPKSELPPLPKAFCDRAPRSLAQSPWQDRFADGWRLWKKALQDGGCTTTGRTLLGNFEQILAAAIDLGHIDYVHGFGSPASAQPVDFRVEQSDETGFVATADDALGRRIITTTFTAPGTVHHRVHRPGAPVEVEILSNLIPSNPNEVLYLSSIAFRASDSVAPFWRPWFTASLGAWGLLMPRVLQHCQNNRTFEEDLNIVSEQAPTKEANPSGIDLPRLILLKWMNSGIHVNRPWWVEDPPTLSTTLWERKRSVVDRYFQHTTTCATCSTHYRRAHQVENGWPIPTVGLLAASALAASAHDNSAAAGLGVGAVCVAMAGQLGRQLRRRLGPSDRTDFRDSF